MSDAPQRYDHDNRSDCYGMKKAADGDFVTFEDYERLRAERDEARTIHNQIVDALETRGYFHAGNGAVIGRTIDDLRAERDAAIKERDEAEHSRLINHAAATVALDQRDAALARLTEAENLLRGFVRRVEAGQIHSVRTFEAFTSFLAKQTNE